MCSPLLSFTPANIHEQYSRTTQTSRPRSPTHRSRLHTMRHQHPRGGRRYDSRTGRHCSVRHSYPTSPTLITSTYFNSSDHDAGNPPFFAGLRKGEGRCFLYQDVKQHKSRVSTGQRKSKSSRQITTPTSNPSRSLETPPTEDLFGPDEFIQANDFVPPPEDGAIDTQSALSHWSNYSSNKRKRRFSAESDDENLDEREQERNKRNRDEVPLPAGNMPFWHIKLMNEQGRS